MLSSHVRRLSRARHSLRRAGVAALVAGLVSVGLLSSPASAAVADVRFVFNQRAGTMVAVGNYGTAPTVQRIIRANGGEVRVVSSIPNNGNAAAFPAFDGRSVGQRAAIAVKNSGSVERLAPGFRTFSFGALVRLSPIRGTSIYDDGNNILQRGLFDDRAQFKLQIERGVAACRVKGSSGAVQVSSDVAIRQGAWYAINCSRVPTTTGATVTITVTPISDTGVRGRTVVKQATNRPVGNIVFPFATPMSIGGKVTDALRIFPRSDQFNGRIDNAYLNIR